MAEGDGSSRNFRSSYYEKLGFCGNEEKSILDLLISSSPFDIEKLSDLSERFDLDKRCIEAWKILLGVECGRRNPFDEYENVRRVRAEHFQSLRHHLEILLRHNLMMKERLKKCSNGQISSTNHDYISQGSHGDSSENNGFPTKQSEVQANDVSNCMNQGDNRLGVQENSFNKAESVVKEPWAKSADQITLMYLLEAGRLESPDIDAQLNSTYCRKLSAMASFFVNVSNDSQEAFFLFRNFARKLEENEALEVKQSKSK